VRESVCVRVCLSPVPSARACLGGCFAQPGRGRGLGGQASCPALALNRPVTCAVVPRRRPACGLRYCATLLRCCCWGPVGPIDGGEGGAVRAGGRAWWLGETSETSHTGGRVWPARSHALARCLCLAWLGWAGLVPQWTDEWVPTGWAPHPGPGVEVGAWEGVRARGEGVACTTSVGAARRVEVVQDQDRPPGGLWTCPCGR